MEIAAELSTLFTAYPAAEHPPQPPSHHACHFGAIKNRVELTPGPGICIRIMAGLLQLSASLGF